MCVCVCVCVYVCFVLYVQPTNVLEVLCESHIDSIRTVGGFCQQNIIGGYIIQCVLVNLQYVYKCTLHVY